MNNTRNRLISQIASEAMVLFFVFVVVFNSPYQPQDFEQDTISAAKASKIIVCHHSHTNSIVQFVEEGFMKIEAVAIEFSFASGQIISRSAFVYSQAISCYQFLFSVYANAP